MIHAFYHASEIQSTKQARSGWAGDGDGGIQVSNALGGQAEEGVHEYVINGVDDGHPDQLASPFTVQSFSSSASYRSTGLLRGQCCVDEQRRCLVDAPNGETEPRPELQFNLKRTYAQRWSSSRSYCSYSYSYIAAFLQKKNTATSLLCDPPELVKIFRLPVHYEISLSLLSEKFFRVCI